MHALVVSPVVSHPQDQGNSARIYSICKNLQRIGYKVHFLIGDMGELTAQSAKLMQKEWDFFHVVNGCFLNKQRSIAEHYLIDDWYDERVGAAAEKLAARWRYDLYLSNYVWFSAWLKHMPDDGLKVIDTHDVFGNRHKALELANTKPAWFYTSPEQEALGLSRADVAIAIQEIEAKYFRTLSRTPIVEIGHLFPSDYLPENAKQRPLRVGYIASANVSNQESLKAFLSDIKKRPTLIEFVRLIVAGRICETPAANDPICEKLGLVRHLSDFYEMVDLVVNPNLGGSGLKIKSIEAMAYGRPLIGTKDAMIGIETDEPAHMCETTDEVCETLLRLINTPDAVTQLAAVSRRTFERYQAKHKAYFAETFGSAALRKPAAADAETLHA